MASPITGPIRTFYNKPSTGYCLESFTQDKWKQAKPRDQALSYLRRDAKVVRYSNLNLPSADAKIGNFELELYTNEGTSPYVSIAYERLKSKISDRASLGVTFAEAHQSVAMIALRVAQFRRFVAGLKQGSPEKAVEALGMKPGSPMWDFRTGRYDSWNRFKRRLKETKWQAKDLAGKYLEFHFGWSPLWGDIWNAVDVLQSPINSQRVRARAKSGVGYYKMGTEENTSNPAAVYPAYTSVKAVNHHLYRIRVQTGCDVAVTNPNLWLANQLGLTNPFAVAIEVIPWSFVADWFINLNTFCGQFSDWYGLTLERAYHTERVNLFWTYYNRATYKWLEGGGYVYGSSTKWADVSASQMKRSTGLAYIPLSIRPWKLWGWRRAAAAVSLATQKLVR